MRAVDRFKYTVYVLAPACTRAAPAGDFQREVFRPPDDDDDKWKKDPNSVKKLRKGDGALVTVKVALGWLINTVAGTIKLPSHRLERLLELLDAFPRSRRSCPKRELQRLLGELRSMILAIPGGVGCLSWIQNQVK